MRNFEDIPILNFTTEEINIIAIYKADTAAATLALIDESVPDILDEDILTIAESAVRKLSALSESEFDALIFSHADETEAEPEGGTDGEGGAYAEIFKESTA